MWYNIGRHFLGQCLKVFSLLITYLVQQDLLKWKSTNKSVS